MGEQATLINSDTLGKPTARLGGGYQPALTPPTWSYATRIQPDTLEGSNIPVYRLFFPSQLTADGTLTTPRWWNFPRNLTILHDMVDAEFPNGFQGKYRADIWWRVRWGKSGNQLFIREIQKVEGPMQAQTELDEHLNAQPGQAESKHETDPAKCKFAMPAHVKRVHGLDDAETGRTIRSIFGMALPDALAKFGVAKCWQMIEDFDTANKPGEVKARFAPTQPADPPAPANASENGQGAALPPPPAIPIAPPAPAPVVEDSSALPAPVKEQSVNYPESPIVVFPQSNGSVIYKGIRFSVTLRLGGKFAAALPLMDDFVKAHENKLIEIDPACLINRPATVMLPPAPSASAPAPVPAAPAPAANGSSTVHIAAIKKVTDEGKTRYELFSDMAADKPALTVRLESVVRDVIAKHIDVNALQIGTRYQVNWTATYTTTEKFSKQANKNVTYRDLATIAPAV